MKQVLRDLDAWVAQQNALLTADGLPGHRDCWIRILGQSALRLANTGLTLVATKDLDVRANYEHAVQKQFEALLAAQGLHLDPVGHEAWMPRETRYAPIYVGRHVRAFIAEPDFVLVSKALKAPAKNRALITEYLAKGASDRFFSLALKYNLDLELFA